MAPKLPSEKQLAAELAKTVRQMYADGKRDEVTVNVVRTRTEERLGLEEDFFKVEAWKSRSKEIIKETAEQIDNEPAPPSSPIIAQMSKPKKQLNSKRRAAADENEPPKKKRQLTRSKPAPKIAEPESGTSELSDSDISEALTKRKQPAKRARQRTKKVVTSDSDEEEDHQDNSPDEDEDSEDSEDFDTSGSEAKPKKRAPKRKAPKKATSKLPEADMEAPASETVSPLSEPANEDSENPAEEEQKPGPIDESSDSEVFDEPPKRKRKSKGASAKPPAKSTKAKPTKAKSTPDISPDAAEIKKLQGYLVKCGVRKIWGVELKQYGDDSRAKIRHLKNMLKEVGMDGRFSEQRAREIKERRELLADVEAVQEMNENLDWGSGVGGRSSRSRAARPKTLKLDDDDDDDDEDRDKDVDEDESAAEGSDDDDDDDDDEEAQNPRARAIAKRRADFAFLGDDDESD